VLVVAASCARSRDPAGMILPRLLPRRTGPAQSPVCCSPESQLPLPEKSHPLATPKNFNPASYPSRGDAGITRIRQIKARSPISRTGGWFWEYLAEKAA
jgi:hypothetical protein